MKFIMNEISKVNKFLTNESSKFRAIYLDNN